MEEKNLKKSENNIVKDRVKTVMRDFGILPILIVVIIIFALMSPKFCNFL